MLRDHVVATLKLITNVLGHVALLVEIEEAGEGELSLPYFD